MKKSTAIIKYHEDNYYKGVAVFLNGSKSFSKMWPEYRKNSEGEWVECMQHCHASSLLEEINHLEYLGYKIKFM
jgi:hypothetical protein